MSKPVTMNMSKKETIIQLAKVGLAFLIIVNGALANVLLFLILTAINSF